MIRAATVIVATIAVLSTAGCGGRGSGINPTKSSSGSGESGPLCPGGESTCSNPPSCAPGGAGMTNCGASNDNCCTSLELTGGMFYRTYATPYSGATGEADPATVSTVRLDKYEVTVGRYRQFVNEWKGGSGWTPPAGSGKHTHLNGGLGLVNSGSVATYESGWSASDNSNIQPTNENLSCDAICNHSTWTASASANENLPINCVNWYEAYAFCIWDGGFLPSEAEWEYAAAGGSQEREFPWGSTEPGTGNQYAIYGQYYPGRAGRLASCPGDVAPVGTADRGFGLWRQLDLAGNVYEWNLDWHFHSYIGPCLDCANLTASGTRVSRGEDFAGGASDSVGVEVVGTGWPEAGLLPPYRDGFYAPPANRTAGGGFRCARAP